jgi:hypothetical protein
MKWTIVPVIVNKLIKLEGVINKNNTSIIKKYKQLSKDHYASIIV